MHNNCVTASSLISLQFLQTKFFIPVFRPGNNSSLSGNLGLAPKNFLQKCSFTTPIVTKFKKKLGLFPTTFNFSNKIVIIFTNISFLRQNRGNFSSSGMQLSHAPGSHLSLQLYTYDMLLTVAFLVLAF